MSSTVFTPYLPRVLIDWQRDTPRSTVREIEGTLVFVDISGFTKMSERLARNGKVGSEEVTDVLNSTFARLLAVAYENGGSLLKFGGDALLLFFMGRAHEPRACHAAAGMRRKLREVGRIQTSAGLVTLRMSIGIHSGAFHFFVVGESHKELIITGPGASRTVEMEHAATAGEILLSPETAACLEASLLGVEKDGGILLRKSPPAPPLPGADFSVEAGPVDASVFVPHSIRSYLVAGPAEGEHRQVTIAFLHFGGIDELLHAHPATDVASMLDRLVRAVQDAVDEYEITFLGSDIDADGGKIILIAGAPQAFDNDEERMLRALRVIADATHGMPLRMGVNRGHVFAGDVGPPYRRTYTVIGDDVNLAARLMQKATPGEIISTADVLDRSRTLFETTALEPFLVKGKARPIVAFRVGAARGSRREEASRAVPLLGRDIEMGVVLDALDRVDRGEGVLAEIAGEAGIGKTRLVEEVVARAAGARVLIARSEQYEAGTPYFPFRSLLRTVAGSSSDDDAKEVGEKLSEHVAVVAPALVPWIPLLAIPAGASVARTPEAEEIADEFRAARMRRTVGEYLAAALATKTVLVFEDAHWMDEGSATLLTHLVESVMPAQPWLIVVARRNEPGGFVPDDNLRRVLIPLDGLTREAAMALATAGGGEGLLPQQLATVADRSGGHPLFVLELVAASRESGGTDALPDTVESVITARIDRLGNTEKQLLRHASVLGATFTLDLLGGITDVAGISDPLTWMRLSDFLEPAAHDTYRFRQALFRDVAYEELSFKLRRKLHRKAGEVLEVRGGDGEDHLGLLSLHFHRAQAYDKSWTYSRLAGESAKAKFASVPAAEFFRRALDASRHIDDVAADELSSVWQALGDVSEIAGIYADAATAYKSARRLAPPDRQPALMLKEGTIRERLGQYSHSLRWFSRGLKAAEALGDAGSSDRVRLLMEIAISRHRQGRYKETVETAKRVAAEAEQTGDRASLARAYMLLQASYTDLGSGEAEHYRTLALPIYEELADLVGQANVLDVMGVGAYWSGRWDEAAASYEKAYALRERAGQSVYAQLDVNNLAEILSDQGHLQEAEEKFREAKRILRAAGHPLGEAYATGNLGRVAARSGRFEEARALCEEALGMFRAIGAENAVLETEARLIELLVFEGGHGEALEQATSALERVAQLGEMLILRSILHRLQGYALLQSGDHVLAQDAFDESLFLARQAKAEYEMALTYQAWTHLARITGRHSSYEKFVAVTNEIFDRLGVVYTREIPLPERIGWGA